MKKEIKDFALVAWRLDKKVCKPIVEYYATFEEARDKAEEARRLLAISGAIGKVEVVRLESFLGKKVMDDFHAGHQLVLSWHIGKGGIPTPSFVDVTLAGPYGEVSLDGGQTWIPGDKIGTEVDVSKFADEIAQLMSYFMSSSLERESFIPFYFRLISLQDYLGELPSMDVRLRAILAFKCDSRLDLVNKTISPKGGW